MRVAVIGAGVLGCAIGWELRRAGFDVLVVDRHGEVGHGSTSASCGIVRRYYSQPGMVALAQESSFVWADWGGHIGPLDDDLATFERPGVLLIPPAIVDSVREVVRSMKRSGVPVHLLDADGVEERFPFLSADSFFPPVPADHESIRAGGRVHFVFLAAAAAREAAEPPADPRHEAGGPP